MGGLEAIKHELAREGSSDVAANEAALKMLCIRGEILTDRPTPPKISRYAASTRYNG